MQPRGKDATTVQSLQIQIRSLALRNFALCLGGAGVGGGGSKRWFLFGFCRWVGVFFFFFFFFFSFLGVSFKMKFCFIEVSFWERLALRVLCSSMFFKQLSIDRGLMHFFVGRWSCLGPSTFFCRDLACFSAIAWCLFSIADSFQFFPSSDFLALSNSFR